MKEFTLFKSISPLKLTSILLMLVGMYNDYILAFDKAQSIYLFVIAINVIEFKKAEKYEM